MYQVLSDDKMKKQYDLHGKQSVVDAKNGVDPRAFFMQIFAGDYFTDVFGEITYLDVLVQNMMPGAAEETAGMTEEEQAKAEVISFLSIFFETKIIKMIGNIHT